MSACVFVIPASDREPARAVIFEMPKSSSFTRSEPSLRFARKRFAGLRSRWTIPAACASARPSHACSV